MYKVSKEVYILLYELYVLACMREPVQGEFSLSQWNSTEGTYTEKEGVPNCGTVGCLAGGYLPLIDGRFHFVGRLGIFKIKEEVNGAIVYSLFTESMFWKLNDHLFSTLFKYDHQASFSKDYKVSLATLHQYTTKEEALDNFRKVLKVLTPNAPNMYGVSQSEYEERLLEEVKYKDLLKRFNHTNRKPKPMTIEAFREWFKRYARLDIFRDSTEYRESILNDFVSGSWYDKE